MFQWLKPNYTTTVGIWSSLDKLVSSFHATSINSLFCVGRVFPRLFQNYVLNRIAFYNRLLSKNWHEQSTCSSHLTDKQESRSSSWRVHDGTGGDVAGFSPEPTLSSQTLFSIRISVSFVSPPLSVDDGDRRSTRHRHRMDGQGRSVFRGRDVSFGKRVFVCTLVLACVWVGVNTFWKHFLDASLAGFSTRWSNRGHDDGWSVSSLFSRVDDDGLVALNLIQRFHSGFNCEKQIFPKLFVIVSDPNGNWKGGTSVEAVYSNKMVNINKAQGPIPKWDIHVFFQQ